MTKHLRFAPILALAAFMAGCQGPCEKIDLGQPRTAVGTASFASFVAVGTSISTGYQSGGVVNRHQINAFPAIFARQIGKTVQLDGKGTFSEPAVDGNGLNPLLHLRSFGPPALIDTVGFSTPGNPINTTFPAPYSNLGVPGSLAFDFGSSARYAGGFFPVTTRGLGTIQHQMFLQQPTFISFEFGANEVLGLATAGTMTPSSPQSAAIINPAAYAAFVGGAMTAIHDTLPAAKVAVFNVPGVTSIPFFTTFPPITRDKLSGGPSPLKGWVHRLVSGSLVWQNTTLNADELVLLTAGPTLAGGTGFQANGYNYVYPIVPGNGNPLDSSLVLDETEIAAIGASVASMNTSLDGIVLADAWVAKVDLNNLLATMTSNGFDIGGVHYSTAFVTGGLFSLDGVHPTDMAHAILANTMIDAVNAKFGSAVPHARVADYATPSSSAVLPLLQPGARAYPARIDGLQTRLNLLFPWR